MNNAPESLNQDEISSPDWLLAGFDESRQLFHCARVDRNTYTESPFLDHRIRPLPTRVATVTGSDVDAFLTRSNLQPAVYIFHTAFCASSLLASCLDHESQTLVLREPAVLSHLGNLPRRRVSSPESDGTNTIRRVTGLLNRSYTGESVIVKPSNFANSLIPDLMDSNEGEVNQRKCIMMSNGLKTLLVSIIKKKEEAEKLLPGFLDALLKDSDYCKRVGLNTTDSLGLMQKSFVFWHCQRYFFQTQRAKIASERVLPIVMDQFLSEPKKTLMRIDGFLNLGLGEAFIEETVEQGAFRRHSKMDMSYSPAQHGEESDAIAVRYADDLDKVIRWSQPLLEQIPVQPLSADENPLL